MGTIRVMIAAGRTLFRQGLKVLIDGDSRFAVIAEAADADEARRCAARETPELIVLDSELPCAEGGCEIIACLRALCPGGAILVLGEADRSAHSEEEGESALRAERAHALMQGAVAYLPARADCGELLRLLAAVAATLGCEDDGPAVTASEAAEAPAKPAVGQSGHRITERERAIIAMIAQGLCNKEVAHRLGIGTQNVKNHVSRLLEKLALADRTQLAVYAVEHHFEF